MMSSSFPRLSCASSHDVDHDNDDDEVGLQWAAIERLPTFTRLRTSLFDHNINNMMINRYGSATTTTTKLQEEKEEAAAGGGGKLGVIDVRKLEPQQKHVFISKLIQKIEQDNQLLLQKLRDRIARYVRKYVRFYIHTYITRALLNPILIFNSALYIYMCVCVRTHY